MTSDRKYQHLFSQFQFRKTLIWIYACVHAKLLHSCPTLCDAMDYSPPGSSVHGILQARILEWIVMPSSRGSSWPRDWTCLSSVSCISWRILYHWCHLRSPKCPRQVPICNCRHLLPSINHMFDSLLIFVLKASGIQWLYLLGPPVYLHNVPHT